MLLLYHPHCNLNPRFAALVTLHIEKFISLFLPSVHFWNRNFLSRWEREESWVLVLDPNAASVPAAGSSPGSGLTHCDSSVAAIRLIAAFLPAPLVSTRIAKSEANTTIFSLQGQSSVLIFVPQLHDSGACDGHCGVSRWSQPRFTARHPPQLTVKSKLR